MSYYVSSNAQSVLPIEIKAGTQGGMKSLWIFMREKELPNAVRCSLENFGAFDYIDNEANGAIRHVDVCPLYAMSMLENFFWGKCNFEGKVASNGQTLKNSEQ